ncbi:GNAT family N-acetyltransferase [Legionella gresilensis]|uniref:GNAT family N-acetyltransferase n=1 Tax=Legionella gresilensis TaxID=91823 RepID=UPI0010410EF8|nr:GNAT family N-acetyltransferase [Legionella gresilensis]
MLLFSSALKKHKITFKTLNNCMEYVPLAAKWAEDEWGYIRNKGVEYREELMRNLSSKVYIGLFAGQPVAMFALIDRNFDESTGASFAQELMYVYVDKNYRGLGFGKQIIDQAKQVTTQLGANLIVLDTLKPSLNRFYENQGAKIVCEGELFSHPTEVLRINL